MRKNTNTKTPVLRLLTREIDFCWMLHEGKSCREISEMTSRSLSRCNKIKASIFRNLGIRGGLKALRKLTKEELQTLIYSSVRMTCSYDYEAHRQAVEAKKEKQRQVWINNVSTEQKRILRAWFNRKSAYLLKKNDGITGKDVKPIIKEVNQLLEAGQAPLGYSLRDLCR